MTTIFLAIGANIGDKKTNISKALTLLAQYISHITVSPIYETKPWGYAKQENFWNLAVKGETDLSAEELLSFVKEVEREVGRVKRFVNGPREIDIDILLYGDSVYSSEKLAIPHPRMQDRDFVLVPLADIAPNVIHPVLNKSIAELLASLSGEKYVVGRVEE